VGIAIGYLSIANAEQPSPPCHPNPNAAADRQTVATRADVTQLPQPLQAQLIRLADRPHTYLPLQVFAEADKPSQLFQYYLLSTDGFEPNVFTTLFPGINDVVQFVMGKVEEKSLTILTRPRSNSCRSGSRRIHISDQPVVNVLYRQHKSHASGRHA